MSTAQTIMHFGRILTSQSLMETVERYLFRAPASL
eukprot:SAG31_NODE_39843_length_285_cov_0.822581_1_plen_34_part_10